MNPNRNLILDESKIKSITRRIAFQIIENNFQESRLVFVGIIGQGYNLAELLIKELKEINSKTQYDLIKLNVDKSSPSLEGISISTNHAALENNTIILVDDVMNTGRTQSYALSFILNANVKKVETVALVDRSHKAFPLSATYSGIELSTTIDEHIEVKLEEERSAYLF